MQTELDISESLMKELTLNRSGSSSSMFVNHFVSISVGRLWQPMLICLCLLARNYFLFLRYRVSLAILYEDNGRAFFVGQLPKRTIFFLTSRFLSSMTTLMSRFINWLFRTGSKAYVTFKRLPLIF